MILSMWRLRGLIAACAPTSAMHERQGTEKNGQYQAERASRGVAANPLAWEDQGI